MSELENLPPGWASAPISDVLEFKYGKGLPAENRRAGDVPVYGSNGIVGSHNEACTRANAIIVGRKGSVGEVHFSEVPCWPIDTTYFIDEIPAELPPLFWTYYLRFLDFGNQEKSSAIPGVSRSDIYQVRVAVPPLAEQRRIVAKLEQVLALVSSCRARLDRVPLLLKRFRQSVLAAACSGRLTEDWREQNPSAEPAQVLVEQIRKERLKAARTDTDKNKICDFFRENEVVEGADADLPNSWLKCDVGHIGGVSNGSTPSRKNPEFWGGNIPWVSSGEVRNTIISDTREKITELGYASTSVRRLPPGTVLIAMIGEGKTRGQSAILEIEATINQNAAAVVIDHGLVVPKYLWFWFQSQYQSNREVGSGSGPQALNCQRVRELSFHLPPLEEQREIVQRVDVLLEWARSIEARTEQARKYFDRLSASVLAQAFRGELVPQDPRDEPASELLARIRAGRAESTVAKPKPRATRAAPSTSGARRGRRRKVEEGGQMRLEG